MLQLIFFGGCVTEDQFLNWFLSVYKKEFPVDLKLIIKYADKNKLPWVLFACEAIYLSNAFQKNYMDKNNPFAVMTIPTGDKNPELDRFRNVENCIALAASEYKTRNFGKQAILLEQSAKKFAETGRVGLPIKLPEDTFKDPVSGFNDKGAGVETDKIVLHLPTLDNPQKVALWVALVGGVVSVTSIFVPQLKPVSLLLTAIKELLKNHKKENIKKEK